MARLPRLSIAGQVHHVIHRGTNSQPVFVDDVDRQSFLDALREASALHGVSVHAYVLMDNHVHLLVTPPTSDALSKAMQTLGRRYVSSYNRRHGRTGTLWEGRFRGTVIESERYFLTVMRYIELNPVRAGWVHRADEWRWSSAIHHLGGRRDPLVIDHPLYWGLGNTPFDREAAYRAALEQGLGESEIKVLTEAAAKGWVLGSAAFLQSLSQVTNRPLVARKRGRPRKPLTQE
jgi:putative transposase